MTIVAAVDRSSRATCGVKEAGALAVAFGDTVHVVHVLNRSGFVDLGRTRVEEGDPADMETVCEIAEVIVAEAVGDLAVPSETIRLVGDPRSEIVDYVDEQDARHVGRLGRKRSPIGKAVFGASLNWPYSTRPARP